MISVKCPYMAEQFLFLRKIDTFRIKGTDGTDDQSQIGDAALYNDVLKRHLFIEKIGEVGTLIA